MFFLLSIRMALGQKETCLKCDEVTKFIDLKTHLESSDQADNDIVHACKLCNERLSHHIGHIVYHVRKSHNVSLSNYCAITKANDDDCFDELDLMAADIEAMEQMGETKQLPTSTVAAQAKTPVGGKNPYVDKKRALQNGGKKACPPPLPVSLSKRRAPDDSGDVSPKKMKLDAKENVPSSGGKRRRGSPRKLSHQVQESSDDVPSNKPPSLTTDQTPKNAKETNSMVR